MARGASVPGALILGIGIAFAGWFVGDGFVKDWKNHRTEEQQRSNPWAQI